MRTPVPLLATFVAIAVGCGAYVARCGRATSLEDALLHALADPTEMNAKPSALVDRLSGIEGYRLQFERLYGDVSWDAVGNALGAFVRCLVTGDSAYDAEVAWRSYRNLDPELLAADAELAARRSQAGEAATRNPFMESARRGGGCSSETAPGAARATTGSTSRTRDSTTSASASQRPNPTSAATA